MAKRAKARNAEEDKERTPRQKTPQNADSIENIAQSLISLAGRLSAIATDIRGAKFETLEVKNYYTLSLGKKNINSFVTACFKALEEAQEQRGDFVAAGGQNGARIAETETEE